MTEIERLLSQAQKDCPHCLGTGIIPGQKVSLVTDDGVVIGSTGDPDRICHCVPIMVIRAKDAPE